MVRSCTLLALVLAALLAPAALASDWYVDAATGSNANTGTSPQSAWRTITHALAASPQTGKQTIHVAAGTYDAPLGESFPLTLRPQLELLGAGSSATTVTGLGAGVSLIYGESLVAGMGWNLGPDVRIEGLRLSSANRGIDLYSDWLSVGPTVRHVDIVSMTSEGLSVRAGSFVNTGAASPTLEAVSIVNCRVGVRFSAIGSNSSLDLLDSTIAGCTEDAVNLQAGTGLFATLTRTELIGNGGRGVYAKVLNNGDIRVLASDCLIGASGAAGMHADETSGLNGRVAFLVARCTVADNGTEGVRALDHVGSLVISALIEDSIVYGNGDDLAYGTGMNVQRSNIGDGDFQGQFGNIAVDPLFVNATFKDWHLSFGSPCLDIGDPLFIQAVADLEGRLRRFDGALDGLDQPDLGAYELQVLQVLGVPRVGSLVDVAVHGPVGVSAPIFRAFAPLHMIPRNHPFGPLLLRRTAMVLGDAPAANPGPPAPGLIAIPNNPALAGMSFSIQALVRPAPGAGFRWTNAVTAIIQP